jgi:hypothetical protein
VSLFDAKYTKAGEHDSPSDVQLTDSQNAQFLGFSYVRSFDANALGSSDEEDDSEYDQDDDDDDDEDDEHQGEGEAEEEAVDAESTA